MGVADEYAEQTAKIFDELGKCLEEQFRDLDNPNDYYKSLMGLNYIIQQNIYHILSDFNMRYRTYQTAGSVRLVFECVADATYLQKNAVESVEYYNAQHRIQTDLKTATSHADKWKVFKKGDINTYGSLDKKTLSRIKGAYGSDGLGAYNFLCFYTHPNIAGAFWHKADQEKGYINLYLIEILNGAILQWLTVLSDSMLPGFNGAEWSGRLAEVYVSTLAKIKNGKEQSNGE